MVEFNKYATQEDLDAWLKNPTGSRAPTSPTVGPWGIGNAKARATQDLDLTPQEQNLYQHHLDNLQMGGVEASGRGKGISTIRGETAEIGGRHYIVPTIWNNQQVTVDQGIENMKKAGLKRYPSYDSDIDAQNRYSAMHEYMEKDSTAAGH